MNSCLTKYFSILGCLLLSVGGLFGQGTDDNSPFSRYGLGDFHTKDFATLSGLAGTNAAYNNPYGLNPANPASYSFLALTSFEAGAFFKAKSLDDGTEQTNVYSGNLDYFALGFQLKNQINRNNEIIKSPYSFGMAFGLMPYTDRDYNLTTTNSDPVFGDVSYVFRGEGGTYKSFAGFSTRYKNLSVGVNANYIFGKISDFRTVTFDSLSYSFLNRFTDELSVGGFTWNAGIQYDLLLKGKDLESNDDDLRIVFGAYGNSTNSINSNSSRYYYRTNPTYGGIDPSFSADTIVYEADEKGTIDLPSEFSFGVMIVRDLKWRAGLNYTLTNWKEYLNSARPETMSNTYKVSGAVEVTPEIDPTKKYIQRVTYRLGGSYEQDPRVIFGRQLRQYGISLGFGLPLQISKTSALSFCNLTLEAGKSGHPEVLDETFFKATVGFTLNDKTWFYKQKFN